MGVSVFLWARVTVDKLANWPLPLNWNLCGVLRSNALVLSAYSNQTHELLELDTSVKNLVQTYLHMIKLYFYVDYRTNSRIPTEERHRAFARFFATRGAPLTKACKKCRLISVL